LVSDIKGRTQNDCVWEQDAEENVWTLEEVTGGRRKLLGEELHNSPPYTSNEDEWAGHVEHMGEKNITYKAF
jgi:hypothetical protein